MTSKVYEVGGRAVADITDGAHARRRRVRPVRHPRRADRRARRLRRRPTSRCSPTTAASTTTGSGSCSAPGRIRRVTASYVGENKEFARQYLAGELEVELTPQGTLAERLRAGGAGIPAFFTPAGVGSPVVRRRPAVALRRRRLGRGRVAAEGDPRVRRQALRARRRSITADFALVHALRGDTAGNLVFDKTAMNFNPLAAMAGRITIAQVEELVEPGEIDPAQVHLPGRVRSAHRRNRPAEQADREADRRDRKEPPDDRDATITGWTRDADGRPRRRGDDRRRVRQPRHRTADADPRLPRPRRSASRCTRRTASSAPARTPPKTPSTPT